MCSLGWRRPDGGVSWHTIRSIELKRSYAKYGQRIQFATTATNRRWSAFKRGRCIFEDRAFAFKSRGVFASKDSVFGSKYSLLQG